MVDIVSILVQSVQSIAVILIIAGMLVAFLWKVTFFVNLALGLIVTILITYLVSVVGKDSGISATILLVGLIGSIIIAAIGGILCLLEGFIMSTLGFWAMWVSGSPANVFSLGILLASAFAAAFSTGISAFLGDRVLSLETIRGGLFPKRGEERKPVEYEILPENSTTPSPAVVDALQMKRIYGYIVAYKEFRLEAIAQRFGLTKEQIENILLEYIAEGKIEGTIDQETGIFRMKDKTHSR